MSSFILTAQAPSNIALVKYMGKSDSSQNLPANPSLSMTLKSLCTIAQVECITSHKIGEYSQLDIQWVPELPYETSEHRFSTFSGKVLQLKERELDRVYRHVQRVWDAMSRNHPHANIPVRLALRTANTFPASSGIASSASSFAAMTWVTASAYCKVHGLPFREWSESNSFKRMLASLSRQGSGSSCRSIEGPWVCWENEDAYPVSCGPQLPKMAHFVVLVESSPKKVSSSEAHSRILTSPLWAGRIERATQRVEKLKQALEQGNVGEIAKIAWADSWEMHSLFHTCSEPFSYWQPGTIHGLHGLSAYLNESIPPIVTLDAGPNIHVIIPLELREKWRKRLKELFPHFQILEDEQGIGASLLD